MSKAKMPLLWTIFTAMVFFACGEISSPSEEDVLTKVKIGVSSKSINFGTTPLNSIKKVSVYLINRDAFDICINLHDYIIVVEPKDDRYSFFNDLGLHSQYIYTLKPNEKLEFYVSFFPMTMGQKSGKMGFLVGPRVDMKEYNPWHNPLPVITDTIWIGLSGKGI